MGTTALDFVLKDQSTSALDGVLGESLRPMKAPLAPSDATQQTFAQPNPQAQRLTGLAAVPGQVMQMGAQALTHPMETATSMVTAPLSAAKTAAQFMGQSAAETSLPADVRAKALADPDRIDESDAALAGLQLALPTLPFTGVAGRGLVGAATGAAYMPEQPIAGALVGGAAGAVHAKLADDPYTMGVRVQRGAEPAPTPEPIPAERQLENPDKVVPSALARVLSEDTAPTRSPVTVTRDVPEVPPIPEERAAAQPSLAQTTPAEPSAPIDDATQQRLNGAESTALTSDTPVLDSVLADSKNETPTILPPSEEANAYAARPGRTIPLRDGSSIHVPDADEPVGAPSVEGANAPHDVPSDPTVPYDPMKDNRAGVVLPDAPGIGTLGARRIADLVRDLGPSLTRTFNPAAGSPDAALTAGNLRDRLATAERQTMVAQENLKAAIAYAGRKMTKAQSIAMVDDYERAQSTGDPLLDHFVEVMRNETEPMTNALIASGRLTNAIENYWGRMWVDPDETKTAALASALAKRPLEGNRDFLKRRFHELNIDGLRAGLTPVTYNYFETELLKLASMHHVTNIDKFIDEETHGLRERAVLPDQDVEEPTTQEVQVSAPRMQYLRVGQQMPPTHDAINDPAFTVYGPGKIEISESFDAKVREGLNRAIRAIPDLEHVRAPKLPSAGGKRPDPRAAGYAMTHGKFMASKFGSESIVIMHELGHILDFRYGLGAYLRGRAEPKGMTPLLDELEKRFRRGSRSRNDVINDDARAMLDQRGKNRKVANELHALAELRYEGTPPEHMDKKDLAYMHDPQEETANALHAFIYMPDRMAQVAPNVKARLTAFLQQHAEQGSRWAKEVMNIKPSLVIAGGTADVKIPGLQIMGKYIAPKPVAQVINNALGKGLRGKPWYDLYMHAADPLNQVQLGASGFHIGFSGLNAVISKTSLALEQLMNRKGWDRLGAIPTALSAPFAGVTGLRSGGALLNELKHPGSSGNDALTKLARYVEMAGGGVGRKLDWSSKQTTQFMDALHHAMGGAKGEVYPTRAAKQWMQAKGAARAAWHLPWAVLESIAGITMTHYVPPIKLAIFRDLAEEAVRRMPPEQQTLDNMRRVMAKIWDSVDNRAGQFRYDRRFMNQTAKHIGMGLLRAPGWTVPSMLELAPGAKELLETPARAYHKYTNPDTDEPVLTHKAAYVAALAFVVMPLIGATYQYLATGQGPESPKDLYFPRDGTYDDDGNANRKSLPSYMRDVWGWFHDPIGTWQNKLNPALQLLNDVFVRNKDYFGNDVRNTHDSIPKQIGQTVSYVAHNAMPISVRNMQESAKRGDSSTGSKIQNFFGVGPASKYIVRSQAQNLMNELLVAHGHAALTPEAAADQKQKSEAMFQLRHGTRDAFTQMVAEGKMSRKQIADSMKRVSQLSLVARFQQLSLPEAEEVFSKASAVEKKMWGPYLTLKRIHETQSGRTVNLQPR